MWTDQWEAVLKDVISEVLETMFFTMIDFDGIEGAIPFGYGSRIGIFDGEGEIVVSLLVTSEFATMITANLLGVDESTVGDEEVEDALREFTNMVGGNYHARRKNPAWSLSIPSAWKVKDAAQGSERQVTNGVNFGCFGEPAGCVHVEYVPGPGQPG